MLQLFKNYLWNSYNVIIMYIYNIVVFFFSFYSIIFIHMANYKFQNLVKTTLWQHFMDNVVCFHPTSMVKYTKKVVHFIIILKCLMKSILNLVLKKKLHRCKCIHVKGAYTICNLWKKMEMKLEIHSTFILLDETHGFSSFKKLNASRSI